MMPTRQTKQKNYLTLSDCALAAGVAVKTARSRAGIERREANLMGHLSRVMLFSTTGFN